MILSERDHSSTVCIGVNETIEIKVMENPTSNNHWVVTIGNDVLQPIESTKSEPINIAGRSRFRTFKIKAMKKGHVTINTIQTRNWIKDPIKTLEFNIHVQ